MAGCRSAPGHLCCIQGASQLQQSVDQVGSGCTLGSVVEFGEHGIQLADRRNVVCLDGKRD